MGRNQDPMVSEAQRRFVAPSSKSYGALGYSQTLGKQLRQSNITFDHPDKEYATCASDLFSKHRDEKYTFKEDLSSGASSRAKPSTALHAFGLTLNHELEWNGKIAPPSA